MNTEARLQLIGLATEAARVDPGPWDYDGRDIFTRSHIGAAGRHLILPLPETWHESQRVPDVLARYVAALSPSVVLDLLGVAENPA